MRKITLTIAAIFAAFTMNAQDTCADAQTITDGSYTVTTIDGTAPVPGDVCFTNQGQPVIPQGDYFAEWFSYTAGANDVVVTVTTDLVANEGGDTRVAIYSGSCSELTCTAGSDDVNYVGEGSPENNLLSEVQFLATAGETYYVMFDNMWSADGFDFEVSSTEDVPEVPGVVTNPMPEDGATDVAVDAQNENGISVSWEAPTTGGEVSSYQVFFGASPEQLNLITTTSNTALTVTGGDYDTEYFWAIVPQNVAGTADQENVQVWSFTTESTAGVDAVNENTFKHYINNNVLTVEANTAIENIRIFNILGQQVATQKIAAQQTEVNVASFKPGVYLAQVQVEGKVKTFKFVKK
ncbi:T9SS type A sorting domain-containing protein [Mesonia aquimarina]|uniref:T9SS type A sorting domain-containing protein n=1 Tax=Mesonia aquimarina TaxID=1504967 RepID=UPI000EF5F65D|nr:T9SS type A sorting domain-containing protein [Mesonia aquimarina]